MYVILVYDVQKKRCGKVMRTAEKYLFHVQESVFEGTLTKTRYDRLKSELQNLIDPESDSVILYVQSACGKIHRAQLGTHLAGNALII